MATRRAATLVVGLIAYTAAAVVGLAHSWAHPSSILIGGGNGDPAQTVWYLRYVPWALGHGHDPLTTAVANWPFGLNLVDQTSVLALGLVASPVTLLFGPIVAYNLCTTAAYVASAGAGYLLCRRYARWRPAAFAGGLLYGFSPYMVGQASHLNLCFVALPPVIFLLVDDLVTTRRRSARADGLALAAAVVVQFFISTEILATTALFGLLTVLVAAVAHPGAARACAGRLATGLAWGAGPAIVVLAWPIEVLLEGTQHITGSVIGFRYYYASLLSPVLPTSNEALGIHRLDHLGNLLGGNLAEDDGYVGVTLLVVALATLVLVRSRGGEARERTSAVRVAAVMALVAFVLSMGTRFHLGTLSHANFGVTRPLPAALIYHVPLLNQALPNRYALYVALYLAVLLACGLAALHDHLTRTGPAGSSGALRTMPVLLPALVAAVALAPLVPAWPIPAQGRASTPAYFTTAEVHAVPSGSVALVYPYPDASSPEAQVWQAAAGFRFAMPGGYFLLPAPGGGSVTSEPTPIATTLTALLGSDPPRRSDALRSSLRAQLAAWHVTSILVRPVGDDPTGFFAWLTGRPPDASVGGLLEWYRTSWTT